ncbi:MAG: Ig-like domain-containing protein, partial [Gemmatimonadetes bacterium]|nr:Ig-like domain-containing protein [Gemmatimonadota bacterium]
MGDTLRLVAEAFDANGHAVAGAEFTWESGDASVATVDGSGLVTGVGLGEAEVTATSSGVSGRAALAVVAPVATMVAVTPDTVELAARGDTVRLTAE